jgi:CPA2 family monovalent cation:H+ antiporter-2
MMDRSDTYSHQSTMPHETTLVAAIAAGLGLAFVLGLVADSRLAAQLAEIGGILLMFGVGLHFSISPASR